jgi:hypothetical protein
MHQPLNRSIALSLAVLMKGIIIIVIIIGPTNAQKQCMPKQPTSPQPLTPSPSKAN